MTAPPPDPASSDRPPLRQEDAEGEGRWVNLVIFGIVVSVIVAGSWLVDALLAARKIDDCISSGRRNCGTELPPPR
jgi:hypothetical protein